MSAPIVAKNKAVFFTYSITDETGEIVEQSDLPIGYVHGIGFGETDPLLTFTDDLENVPPQFQQVGAEVEMQNDNGEVKKFVVSKIEDGKLTVDGNHPLAGKNITFNITITDIRDAEPEEIQAGRPQDNTPPMLH